MFVFEIFLSIKAFVVGVNNLKHKNRRIFGNFDSVFHECSEVNWTIFLKYMMIVYQSYSDKQVVGVHCSVSPSQCREEALYSIRYIYYYMNK